MSRKRVVVINQHGENRGDEAAMRAMIRGLDRELGGGADFDIVVQFRDRSLVIPFEQAVRLHHMVMPIGEIALLGVYAVGRALGLDARFLLSTEGRGIIGAIDRADLVVSAPGGPYFGDIYASHEPVHWLYVWLAKLHRKPLFLYAPSVGPFNRTMLNRFRRRVFGMFDRLCVREAGSLAYLQKLLGPLADIHLTADATIQEVIEPFQKTDYFHDERATLANKFIVAVTAMQYRYPGDPDPSAQRAHFTEAFMVCLEHLANRKDCHFIFLPQLCGKVHNDSLYHELLGKRLPAGTSWEVVPADFDSDQQRKVFGMADLCLASRYHPQIFATTCGVPGVFLCYEHKQFAYLEAVGMREFAFDIRKPDTSILCARLDEVIERREALVDTLRERTVSLREASRQSTRLAVGLLRRTGTD